MKDAPATSLAKPVPGTAVCVSAPVVVEFTVVTVVLLSPTTDRSVVRFNITSV